MACKPASILMNAHYAVNDHIQSSSSSFILHPFRVAEWFALSGHLLIPQNLDALCRTDFFQVPVHAYRILEQPRFHSFTAGGQVPLFIFRPFELDDDVEPVRRFSDGDFIQGLLLHGYFQIALQNAVGGTAWGSVHGCAVVGCGHVWDSLSLGDRVGAKTGAWPLPCDRLRRCSGACRYPPGPVSIGRSCCRSSRYAGSLRCGRCFSRASSRRCLTRSWFLSDRNKSRFSRPVNTFGRARFRWSVMCSFTLSPKCFCTARRSSGKPASISAIISMPVPGPYSSKRCRVLSSAFSGRA